MGVCRHYLASAHELNDMISHDGEQEKKKKKKKTKNKNLQGTALHVNISWV